MKTVKLEEITDNFINSRYIKRGRRLELYELDIRTTIDRNGNLKEEFIHFNYLKDIILISDLVISDRYPKNFLDVRANSRCIGTLAIENLRLIFVDGKGEKYVTDLIKQVTPFMGGYKIITETEQLYVKHID